MHRRAVSVSGRDVRLQQSSLLAVHLACKIIGHIVRDVPRTVLVPVYIPGSHSELRLATA